MFHFDNVGLRKKNSPKTVKESLTGSPDIQILSAINLQIAPGQVTAVLGPSGAGKSSLLRLMNRLDDPTDGTLYYDDRPLNSYPVLALRRRVGMVFQIPVMFPGSVAENIGYAARYSSARSETAFQNSETASQNPVTSDPTEFLNMVGLPPELAAQNAEVLSVGQQQRVALARTLANHPDVLLLDEPTASLDPASATAIMELIGRLRTQLGLTVVMVTHILEHAKTYSDFTAFIHQGRLLEACPTPQFFTNPETDEARTFIGGNGGLP